MIADKGNELGVPVPIHRGLTTIVKRIERRELTPGKSNILNLITSESHER